MGCDKIKFMKLKKYVYQNFVKEIMFLICIELKNGSTLTIAKRKFRDLVNSYIGLNRNERAKLFNIALDIMKRAKAQRSELRWEHILSQCTVYNQIVTTARKVQASFNLRKKRISTKLSLADNNIIFFLCSNHYDSALDHAPYQGKVYVDRYWRHKVSGTEYYAVSAYIKNHNTISIQEIMGAPVYMTTRPYCRHYFTPISTNQVLGSSTKKLLKDTGSNHYNSHPYTNERYIQERKDTYLFLNGKFPNKFFRFMSKKSK